MGQDAKTKDTRLQAKRAQKGLAQLVDDAMNGRATGREGAEAAGLRAIVGLVQLYVMGEGPLPDAMRELVTMIHNKSDPLRRDIPPDAWAALWPTLNALTEARRKYVETVEAVIRSRSEGAAPEAPADDVGTRLLRAGGGEP